MCNRLGSFKLENHMLGLAFCEFILRFVKAFDLGCCNLLILFSCLFNSDFFIKLYEVYTLGLSFWQHECLENVEIYSSGSVFVLISVGEKLINVILH